MPDPRELKKEDFVVNFESKGLPFLFVDMSVRNYYEMLYECITFGDLYWTRDLMGKETLRRMAQEGSVRTPEQTRSQIAVLDSVILQLAEKTEILRQLQTVEKTFALEVLSLIATLCREYTYFDANYWEGVFNTPEAQETISLVQSYKNVIRAKFEAICFNSNSTLHTLAAKVGAHRGISIDTLLASTEAEFISVVDGGELNQEAIKDRKIGYFYYKCGSKWFFLEGKEALPAIAIFENSLGESPDVFKGKAANRGQKVVAKARVITRDFGAGEGMRKQMHDMRQGEILVSETTDPEMMEACRKSAAMVADVGGMLSHTAITSRELGIPCIVQTGNASKFIKTGDLIEVDADTGTVSILQTSVPVISTISADYLRLFATKSMSYFASDLFMGYYKQVSGLALSAEDSWSSWMPLPSIEKAAQEGVELYGNETAFSEYRAAFDTYEKEIVQVCEETLHLPQLSGDTVVRMLNKMADLFRFYTKTEFFYTDPAFAHINEEPFATTLKQFESIKNDKRILLNKIFYEPNSYRRQLMAKVKEQLGVDIEMYGMREIAELFDGKRISPERIAARRQAYVMKGDSGTITYLEGEEAMRFANQFLETKEKSKEDVLRGSTAQKGKITAQATVVVYGDNLFKRLSEVVEAMPKGNVLIAETTAPELIPMCLKASAIVTNQGGMMSHAAIVSRELKIPCIVGVAHATEVIKNGDLIEVDADSGVVKILKRA